MFENFSFSSVGQALNLRFVIFNYAFVYVLIFVPNAWHIETPRGNNTETENSAKIEEVDEEIVKWKDRNLVKTKDKQFNPAMSARFHANERVLAFHGPLIYEAKVLKVAQIKDKNQKSGQ